MYSVCILYIYKTDGCLFKTRSSLSLTSKKLSLTNILVHHYHHRCLCRRRLLSFNIHFIIHNNVDVWMMNSIFFSSFFFFFNQNKIDINIWRKWYSPTHTETFTHYFNVGKDCHIIFFFCFFHCQSLWIHIFSSLFVCSKIYSIFFVFGFGHKFRSFFLLLVLDDDDKEGKKTHGRI